MTSPKSIAAIERVKDARWFLIKCIGDLKAGVNIFESDPDRVRDSLVILDQQERLSLFSTIVGLEFLRGSKPAAYDDETRSLLWIWNCINDFPKNPRVAMRELPERLRQLGILSVEMPSLQQIRQWSLSARIFEVPSHYAEAVHILPEKCDRPILSSDQSFAVYRGSRDLDKYYIYYPGDIAVACLRNPVPCLMPTITPDSKYIIARGYHGFDGYKYWIYNRYGKPVTSWEKCGPLL